MKHRCWTVHVAPASDPEQRGVSAFSLLSQVEEDVSRSCVCLRLLPPVCSKLSVSQSLSSSFHLDLSPSITRFQSFILGLPPSRDRQINLACKWFNSLVPAVRRETHLLQGMRKCCCQGWNWAAAAASRYPAPPPSGGTHQQSTACLGISAGEDHSNGLSLFITSISDRFNF